MSEASTFAINAFKAAVGENIMSVREDKGLAHGHLAAMAGISAKHLRQIERGVANPRLLTLERIACSLEVDLAVLLDVAGTALGLAYTNARSADEE